MTLAMAFKMSWESIKSSKMRSFLTMLGIIIGISSVIILVSLVQGAMNEITESISSLGTNTVIVNISFGADTRSVTTDDLDDLLFENQDYISGYIPSSSSSATLKAGSENMKSNVDGTNEYYTLVKSVDTQLGRMITRLDIVNNNRVIVLGEYNATELFGGVKAALDQEIKVNGEMFKVVGILERKGDVTQGSSDDKALIPFSTAQRLFKNTSLRSFTVQAASVDAVTNAKALVEKMLFEHFADTDAYTIINMQEMLDKLSSIMGMMAGVLGGIAGISLLVAGIGIMNIMLVSVTERTREIGIRKAIGAKRSSILVQFLIEAIVVSLIGGIIGIIFGVGVSILVGNALKLTVMPSIGILIFSLFYSLGVGVFFGLYPANKASKLNPIEALRFE